MEPCEECGSANVSATVVDGVQLFECGLCGALTGSDEAVTRVMLIREARELGVHPEVYPLVRALDRSPFFRVVSSHGGDAEGRVWPFVMLATTDTGAMLAVENLAKSLALSARGHDIHWVVEVEYRHRLVFTLKPRFHRDPDRIGPDLVRAARGDMDRIRRNLERDMGLSWWRDA